jgi:osmoprotectant transport system permease protein
LPIVRNTYAGLGSVDSAALEAARGMGMTPAQILRKVSLPLALPVVMGGIRRPRSSTSAWRRSPR